MILRRDGENSVIIDAVLAGRDFYKEVGPPDNSLPVPLDFLIRMTEAYASRSLNHIHQIAVEGALWPKNRFWSILCREEQGSKILVHHSLNFCHTRFAVAIELGGIIMADNAPFAITDIVAHLNGLLSGLAPQRDNPLYAEVLAQLLAIELLMPMHHRKAMDEFIARKADSLEVAKAFRVPQFVAEWSMSGGWNERVRLHDTIADPPPLAPGHALDGQVR